VREVSIVIPAVGGTLGALCRCIDALRRHTPPVYELIVVASRLDALTADYLLDLVIKGIARVVLNPGTVGPYKQTNIGFRLARGRFLVYLSSDSYVRAGWLEPLLRLLRRSPSVGWASPRTPTNRFHTGCMVITRAAWERVGPMDEGYRIAFGDDDYLRRFIAEGFTPTGCSASIVDHPESAVSIRTVHGPDERRRLYAEDQRRLMRKWGHSGTNWERMPITDRFDWLRAAADGLTLDLGSAGGHTFGAGAVNLDLDLYRAPNFVRADGHRLPFRDGAFDTVAVGDALEHAADPVALLREARRVGRRLIATVPDESRGPLEPLMSDVYGRGEDYHRRAVERWVRDNRPVEMVDDLRTPHLFHVRRYTRRLLEGHLRAAGYDDYRIGRIEHPLYSGFTVIADG